MLQVQVFSSVDEHASVAMSEVESEVNEFLQDYASTNVVSVTSQVTEFEFKGGDYPQGENMTRFTVTVVYKK